MVDIIGMYPYWNFVQKKKAFIPMLLVIISTVLIIGIYPYSNYNWNLSLFQL